MSIDSLRASVCFVAGICLAAPAFAGSSLSESRSALEQWVETRQLISKARDDWGSDKEMLERTVALYERELASIEEQKSKISTNNTQVAREMTEAEASKTSSSETLERARQFAVDFEVMLKRQVPAFPQPLQDILKPFLARMPADPANTSLPAMERIQVIVQSLNEVDKFNNAVNVFSEKRKNEKGEEVSVQTIYVGLGAAYFVNETADFAGTGAPGPNGWTWTVKPGLASDLQEAVKMYRNERTAHFVALPVTIQ